MELSVSEPALDLVGQSPADWDQIEDHREVNRVLSSLQKVARTAVYECPELYELAYPGYPGDRDYYLEETQAGRVLYLGVGTGRIFLPMVAQNPQAYGVEYSPEMCRLLERRQPKVADHLLQCDATEAPIQRRSLDTVVAPYSFLQVVGRKCIPELLNRIHTWLKPEGRFLTDTFSPYAIPFRRPGLEASIRQIGAQTRIAIYILYDHVLQQMQELALIERDGDESRVLDMRLEYFFPREVVEDIQRAGFDPVHVRGGFDGRPFNPVENDVVVYEAVKPPVTNGHVRAHANGTAKV